MLFSAPTCIQIRNLCIALFLVCLTTACVNLKKEQVIEEPSPPVVVEQAPQFSVAPIIKPLKKDIRFAQSALTKVGYNIGPVDGIWGGRSKKALIAFETKHDIWSADGFLSEQNLHTLEEQSGLLRQNFLKRKVAQRKKIAQLLNKKKALKKGPQLIILERNYLMLSKPNPYSSRLLRLTSGTGIYVVARQDGWYKVESLERQQGYIKVD